MRVFDQTLAALAEGRQPSIDELSQVCYLMRNTGLDCNGTFGTRSFPWARIMRWAGRCKRNSSPPI